jgi:hypothetical protein
MRGNCMAENLASFGGITRIRFKGSPAQFCRRLLRPNEQSAKLELDSQPGGSPALTFENKTRAQQVNKLRGYRLAFIVGRLCQTPTKWRLVQTPYKLPTIFAIQSSGSNVSVDYALLLPPVLRWCERSGAIRRPSFARPTPRCRCPRRLCRPRCLPPSRGRSRVPCPHRS